MMPATGAVEIEIDGIRVNARDGAAIVRTETIRVTAIKHSETPFVDAA